MNEDLQKPLANLPHGPAFRFVDRLTQLSPGQAAEGEYRLRGDEWFLAGHFPGNPLMPGVLLIEAGAQLAGVAAQCDPQRPVLADLKLVAVHGVKILGTAGPGQTIRIKAEIVARLDNLVKARISIHSGTQLLLTGEVSLGGKGPPLAAGA